MAFPKTPVMEGTGTAAGEAYAWAIENPDKVACIVGHNPALRSLMSKTAPLENLATLAKAGVPLLHVCDKRDPWFNDQTKVVEQRYNELGGQLPSSSTRTMRVIRLRRQTRVASSISSSGKQSELGYEYDTI